MTPATKYVAPLNHQAGIRQVEPEKHIRDGLAKPFSEGRTTLIVTDHCILRWLERKYGFDLDAVMASMPRASNKDVLRALHASHGFDIDAARAEVASRVSPRASAMLMAGGDMGTVRIRHEGMVYVAANGRMLTCYPERRRAGKARDSSNKKSKHSMRSAGRKIRKMDRRRG